MSTPNRPAPAEQFFRSDPEAISNARGMCNALADEVVGMLPLVLEAAREAGKAFKPAKALILDAEDMPAEMLTDGLRCEVWLIGLPVLNEPGEAER